MIVGYTTYIKLLTGLIAGKKVVATGMTTEVERAAKAVALARQGKKVCVVSSGDPGIYGMAGLILELLNRNDAERLKIEIIPGITAASASAALLGAPLAQDFAIISLSDLLVKRKEIETKLEAAAEADFVIVLYNPKSKTRIKPLERAWVIIRQHRPLTTPVGMVKNAFRPGEEIRIMPLKDAILVKDIDMVTTIIVGNSRTFVKGRYMVTKRGYDIS